MSLGKGADGRASYQSRGIWLIGTARVSLHRPRENEMRCKAQAKKKENEHVDGSAWLKTRGCVRQPEVNQGTPA